jgi:hypothetical protein
MPGQKRIAEIEEHKVKTGESIKSLADANGLRWQELAKFNWGTDVPDEINKHLRDEVGCTKKTRDGYNYMFDDLDDPGIMYIPKQWSEDGLQTDKTHTIRVTFAYELQFVLVSEDSGHRLSFHEFLVRDEHGQEIARDRTNAEGGARVGVGRLGEYFVDLDPAGECQLHGTIFANDGITPLRRFSLQARDWSGAVFQANTNEVGDFKLEAVASGEVVFSHEGQDVIVRAVRDSDQVGVRLRNVEGGGIPDPSIDDHAVETMPPAPDAKLPPEEV